MQKWNQETIKQALLRGDITSQEAFELITKPGVKPWETKEWEEMRAARLGPACTQCGSTQSPLVLQHLWQPQGLKQLVLRFRTKYRMEYKVTHPRPVVKALEPKGEQAVCPHCWSVSIYARKKTQDWRCAGCKQFFTQPGVVKVLTEEQAAAYSLAEKQAYDAWNQTFLDLYADQFRTEAILISIEEHQRYISCEDTTTFCKRCAFLWDVKRQKGLPRAVSYPTEEE
jgi:ribosomal protein L37AE/L43A